MILHRCGPKIRVMFAHLTQFKALLYSALKARSGSVEPIHRFWQGRSTITMPIPGRDQPCVVGDNECAVR